MIVVDCVQGSEEWLQARLGKVTASRVADVIARTKSGWGASRANYQAQLIAERLTGTVAEGYTNATMRRGNMVEPDARACYSFRNDIDVESVGFVEHPSILMAGASPDGLVGKDGLVEIKCPNTATHLETLLGDAIPGKYLTQIRWQLACTGRHWCDFVSFDPRLPEQMRMFVERIGRDDAVIRSLENNVADFLAETDRKVGELTDRYLRIAA